MIKNMFQEGSNLPVVICDICGGWIYNAADGAAVSTQAEKDGDFSVVMHVHKGHCHELAEKKMGDGAAAGWDELQDHLLELSNNSGLTIPQREVALAENG